MPVRDLVVIGASAGGVEALTRLVRGLPEDLPAAILVVMHMAPDSRSNLPTILERAGPLPAAAASDGDRIEPGTILVAQPDHHLAVADGAVRVVRGPHENLHRPSVDVLFRSAGIRHGGRTCGIVLSGALDDGTSGMRVIHDAGGLTIVQDPADALVPGMPRSVIQAFPPDHVLTAEEIGVRLPLLLEAPRPEGGRRGPQPAGVEQEIAMSQLDPAAYDQPPPGEPSPFGCPECGGVLWEIPDGRGARYRCRVGHGFTAKSLMAAEDAQLEDALWAALRALEEQESLSRRLLDRRRASGSERTRDRLMERAEEAHRRAQVLRELLLTPMRDATNGGDPDERTAEPRRTSHVRAATGGREP